ncbi:hypothetical protein [Halovenus salina]|uniref:hypothetical protein n=1 Tax=Halovenus salina TaxID=1510225 RepID=UPI002260943C|nr:hypothetical protein [Halovenus salina]
MLQSAQLSTDVAPEETADKTADRRIARRSEELHLRNFDVSREHTLTVRVSDDDGLVFANRYYLTPGKTVSELGRIPPGEYEVRVELDGRRQQTATCEIGERPSKTALVEVGNGTVSLTEGLYR